MLGTAAGAVLLSGCGAVDLPLAAVRAGADGTPYALIRPCGDDHYQGLSLDGWAGAYLNRQGYYAAVLETAKEKMEPYEWAYWMEGKPAEKDIKAPDGTLLEKAGAKRDGGSYDDRMGGVACWNAVMDENDYMVKKWNEFIAA